MRFVCDILTKNAHYVFNLYSFNFDINNSSSISDFKDDDSSFTTQYSLTILKIYRRKIYIFIFLCKGNNDIKHRWPKEGQQSSP